ncbi:MAG: 3-oxoadipate enol-lactonase [Actinomycetes bacterium]
MTAVDVSYTAHGVADAPVVVLSNSLGATRGMWDPQVPALAERFRVVTYDTRGHGESLAPCGPYTIDDLVDDLVALLDAVGAQRAHVAGLSLGGMTAMRLAAREPARVDRLALLATSARPDPQVFLDRARTARSGGTAAMAPAVAARWLTPVYAAAHPDLVARLEAMIATADDEGYAACCEVIAQLDLRAEIGGITAPTLVISGREDPALPPEHQELIAGTIPGAELVSVSPGAHLPNLEQDLQVTGALLGHFDAGGAGSGSSA